MLDRACQAAVPTAAADDERAGALAGDKACVMTIDGWAVPHPPPEDRGAPGDAPMDPYLAFVGAFLRQVVADARSTTEVQREAEAFLVDRPRLTPWIELTGADVDTMQEVL